MDEETFDSLHRLLPFTSADAANAEARLRRCMPLGIALFGKTSDDLRRQLSLPHPEIPPGFDLADFEELHRMTQTFAEIASRPADPRFAWLSRSSFHSLVGMRSFNDWEARIEIVRRALDYLRG
jgi:hypothetical protein